MLVIAEDELQNIEMAEEERTKMVNELKIKKRDYTGYDDEEFEPGKQGMKRAVLAKYDEDIEGPRQTVRYSKLFSSPRNPTANFAGLPSWKRHGGK
jgi:hypothetical protein